MEKRRDLVWILLAGGAWGLWEVFAGAVPGLADTLPGTALCTAGALFFLAAARALVRRPGASLAVAVAAAAFRLINAGPFYCHFAGILLLGAAFEGVCGLFLAGPSKKSALRSGLAGAAAAYAGHALFVCAALFAFRSPYWTAAPLESASGHILAAGSLAAAAAFFLVPLGFRAGDKARALSQSGSRWVPGAAAIAAALVWILGVVT